MTDKLTVIGRAEKAAFPDLALSEVPAKIDTGADACAIWAQASLSEDGTLRVVFFDKKSVFYTGIEYAFGPGDFTVTRVANSFGHRELRYKVKLRISVKQRLIRGTFTLSDRSKKLYPVLIGRSLLHGKFIVDVAKGSPLRAEEKERSKKLQQDLKAVTGGEE